MFTCFCPCGGSFATGFLDDWLDATERQASLRAAQLLSNQPSGSVLSKHLVAGFPADRLGGFYLFRWDGFISPLHAGGMIGGGRHSLTAGLQAEIGGGNGTHC